MLKKVENVNIPNSLRNVGPFLEEAQSLLRYGCLRFYGSLFHVFKVLIVYIDIYTYINDFSF